MFPIIRTELSLQAMPIQRTTTSQNNGIWIYIAVTSVHFTHANTHIVTTDTCILTCTYSGSRDNFRSCNGCCLLLYFLHCCVSPSHVTVVFTNMYSYRTIERSKGRSQNYDKRQLALLSTSVRPSVRMEQLGSHWTDFHEIWCLNIFQKNRWENWNFIKIWRE